MGNRGSLKTERQRKTKRYIARYIDSRSINDIGVKNIFFSPAEGRKRNRGSLATKKLRKRKR